MKELTLQEQCQLCGGSATATIIIYLLLGATLYKIYKSKRGRISIPKIIRIDWRS